VPTITLHGNHTTWKARQALEQESHAVQQLVAGPLDSLIKGLMAFTTRQDLSNKLQGLYQRIDVDDSGVGLLHERKFCAHVFRCMLGVRERESTSMHAHTCVRTRMLVRM
jgi:hypothetical protein